MASVRKAFDWSTVLITVCMLTAAVVVYLRDGQERFAAVFFNDLEIFLDILPKMAAGCLIGVFSTLLIPREVVARLVGAEFGAALAFVTSWTLLGYARALVWELPFFGPDFVLWRVAIAPLFPIIVGLLGRFVANILLGRGIKL